MSRALEKPVMDGDEPHPRQFTVGPDREGMWIVCDGEGSCGAVFASREAALRFAKSECDALRPAIAELRIVASLDWRQMFGA